MALTIEQINERVAKVKAVLRNKRLKHGVDYAFVVKYAEVRVVYDEIYDTEIRQACANAELPITSFHTY